MSEKYEVIFWEVADELNITNWWELFDSDDFDKVENRIAERFGADELNTVDYLNWYNEMAMDL